jgi:hypothetical protein
LAALDELPRVSLLNEPFLWWPDAVLPSVAAFAREALFGTTEHPHVIETVDGVDEGRLEQVRRGIGLTSILIPASGDLPSPPGGVVFRRVEPPRPLIGYGLLWVEPNASPATARFLEVARRIVADPPGTDDAAARRPRRAWSS